jgi:hypothetical protein
MRGGFLIHPSGKAICLESTQTFGGVKMSIKGQVWLQFGDPFGGPRFGPPLHSEWAEKPSSIFQKLELRITEVYKTIAHQPPTEWERLAHAAKPPEINGRRVRVNLNYGTDDLGEFLFIRARLSFPLWPLGGWVVVEGWKRPQDGAWTPLPVEELEKTW